ncbi:RDD family protein [Kitasatospora sp. MAP5-34]|uniref:RDD family protein n=1 Tax=Kitasatospora sp. MAP5-34 TaxID=3035102 RepID=UPI002474B113|nr:RDD family protein [Kitasatospora sp. MAP5-34]MDH6580783.1 putative RDD family membrane protein YckC [Kitasatospora sp. MAP5-34]
MSDLVTGEAVVLGLRTAKLPSRALAITIDMTVQWGALFASVLVLAFAAPDLDVAARAAASLGLVVFYMVALPVLIETLSRGRSLGKLAFGLRVVRTDGGPVRFRHALVRGLVGFAELLMFVGIPAVITSLISEQGRRLGDIFAGTLVVRERVPGGGRGQDVLPPLPPELLRSLGGELVALDLSAVPDGLWLAIRQYLGRLGQLDPAVSQQMAHRLVGDLVAHTGRPAPYGPHPAAYLGAVLSERQRREWARTMGAQQQHQIGQQYQGGYQHQGGQQVQQQPYQAPVQATHPQPQPPQVPPATTPGGFAPPA